MTKRRRLREVAGLAETANLLMLRLALTDRSAARQYPGLCFRNYVGLHGKAPWRSATIFEFMPELEAGRIRVTLEHVPGEGISTAVDELAYMALITAALRPSRIFEIGTFRGRTALNFAVNSPDDCEVLTLDLPPDVTSGHGALGAADRRIVEVRKVGADYAGRSESEKITQLFGDSTKFDFSPWRRACDLVFVDGGHSYDVCRSDTRTALTLCKPGGIILWHDWANYGEYHDVTRAVLSELPGDSIVQLHSCQLAAFRAPC